ncbi:hypothetical protein N654_1425 [Lactiplantibacillus plantarum 4_3]|nr:hypothetical protein N654_1425 [Lactiplantibacillus plantarum 4_3]
MDLKLNITTQFQKVCKEYNLIYVNHTSLKIDIPAFMN